MTLNLRLRIFLTLLPLLVLLAVVGSAGAVLLYRLGGSIDLILRENYRSVIYMERLNEALERIDSSFQFALAGQEEKAREQYVPNWAAYREALQGEVENITLPGEAELVDQLSELTHHYRKQGDAFYARPAGQRERHEDYFGAGGLLDRFKEIKRVSGEILRINQENMEEASKEARDTAFASLVWFGAGLLVAVLLAIYIAWRTVQTVIWPIRAVTQSAFGISTGNLNQVVPVLARDELGQLAEAFNVMARHLRDYRQSNLSQLLRAQRTSQATIDSFPDPVLVVDSEGLVEMANPAARKLLGVIPRLPEAQAELPWQPPEALRSPLKEALLNQHEYLPEEFDRAVLLGSPGSERAFLPRILPIRDPYGNTLGAAVLLQDVTRFRLLDQFKTDLVATVSHELKTPLTSLRLDLHLALEESLGPLTPKHTELLLDARDNAERLLGIVNNLLDLARLEQKRDRLEIKPESPAELLQAAADTLRPRAADKQIEVGVEAPADLPAVAVDRMRLAHALNNLLDNALAYTQAGGRIALTAAGGGEQVTLSVADTGIGIPAEHLPHVFDKFHRIPGHSRGSGTGLGLAIVQEIVTAMGGTVTCDSRPGVGTVFRITLPVANPPPLLQGSAAQVPAASAAR
jgi:signal transduction histidine kinase/HAMP domain-containing protein